MDKGIFVVGVGGTGGLLVPKLAKILNGMPGVELWLMDGDIVDNGNVERQPYQQFNVNEKKTVALARKVSSNYDITVFEYSDYITGEEISTLAFDRCYDDVLIIGCVDNHSTRMLLEEDFRLMKSCMYIDSANGEDDGSIFIATTGRGTLRSEVFPDIKEVSDHPTGTCGAAIADGNMQQMVTNDIMANSIAKIVYENLMGESMTGVIKIDGFERIFIRD